MRTVLLSFDNRTAPDRHAFHISRDGVPLVMDWYGAFYAGDDYSVFINGVKQVRGINGELEGVTIDGTTSETEGE